MKRKDVIECRVDELIFGDEFFTTITGNPSAKRIVSKTLDSSYIAAPVSGGAAFNLTSDKKVYRKKRLIDIV